jgi:hypothetical protein
MMVEETDWMPAPKPRAGPVVVGGRIEVAERAWQQAVNAGGGQWRPAKPVWELPDEKAVALGLHDRLWEHSA